MSTRNKVQTGGGAILILLVVFAAAVWSAPTWLATGTVTRVDGSTFYFLGKDNVVYGINAAESEVMLDQYTTDCTALQVGDTVRVFGYKAGQNSIDAVRVRIFNRAPATTAAGAGAGPEKEIKIVIEKNQPPETAPPALCENGVAPVGPKQICPDWRSRGLITDIDYDGRRVKLQNSEGSFSINVGRALLSNGARRISFSQLGQGDSVEVAGVKVGDYEVNALTLEVGRTRYQAENALPALPVSIAGFITQIDYPSMTFKMQGETAPFVVGCDGKTVIQQYQKLLGFEDLRPGMKVKMSGNGSLGTGYAARHIQIISVAP